MIVDHERAWLSLKAYVMTRRSHGQDALLGQITRIELECSVPEGQEGFSDLPAHGALPRDHASHDVPAGAT